MWEFRQINCGLSTTWLRGWGEDDMFQSSVLSDICDHMCRPHGSKHVFGCWFGIILWFSTGVPPFVSWFINPFKYTVIAIYEYYIYIYPDVSMKPSYISFEEAWLTCLSKKLQLRQQSSSWKAEKDWRSAGKSSVAWFQWLENQLCVNGYFYLGK